MSEKFAYHILVMLLAIAGGILVTGSIQFIKFTSEWRKQFPEHAGDIFRPNHKDFLSSQLSETCRLFRRRYWACVGAFLTVILVMAGSVFASRNF